MTLVTASCDGHASLLDIESGSHYVLCNLNPDGWVDGVTNERNWDMVQSLAVHEAHPNLSWAGDNRGNVRSITVHIKGSNLEWKCTSHLCADARDSDPVTGSCNGVL
jgi:hypothetical protein